jgi:hypothetical protein
MPNDDNETGVCVRWPPQVAFARDGKVISTWPTVNQGAWCGEWKRGEEKRAKFRITSATNDVGGVG